LQADGDRYRSPVRTPPRMRCLEVEAERIYMRARDSFSPAGGRGDGCVGRIGWRLFLR